jgi:hypothetical protein
MLLFHLFPSKMIVIVVFSLSGRQDEADAMLAALEVLTEPYKSMAVTLVDVCAYAGMFYALNN